MLLRQNYQAYTKEDFNVWNRLFVNQHYVLEEKAHPEYLECLNELSDNLNHKTIPSIQELNSVLKLRTGWTINVVPGLISEDQFFQFLATKKFPSSTWLRPMNSLDYLEEPDMFHDIFGHIPLLLNYEFSSFAQRIGALGVLYRDDPDVLKKLQKIYWYTIEFGLISYRNELRVYGAGIISSTKETHHIFNDDVEILPFDINQIMQDEFEISEIQNRYYRIETFDMLYDAIIDLEYTLPRRN